MHAIPSPLMLCLASWSRKALLPWRPAHAAWILRAAAASSKVYLKEAKKEKQQPPECSRTQGWGGWGNFHVC